MTHAWTHARTPRSPAIPDPTAPAALVAAIKASSIRVPAGSVRRATRAGAPGGYDGTDRRILEWIAAHRRGPRGRFLLH